VLAMNTCILISNECMDFDISSGDTTMFTKWCGSIISMHKSMQRTIILRTSITIYNSI
jgi:hypothetical protein